MDRQLEICGARNICVQGIRYSPHCCPSYIARSLRSDPLDSTLWPFDTSVDIDSNQASSSSSPANDIPQYHTILYFDIHFHIHGHWHALRTIPSLPILCLYRLVDTISAMERWPTSNPDIRCLGSPRVGVERISEHQHQLDRGSRVFGPPGGFCMVGYGERLC